MYVTRLGLIPYTLCVVTALWVHSLKTELHINDFSSALVRTACISFQNSESHIVMTDSLIDKVVSLCSVCHSLSSHHGSSHDERTAPFTCTQTLKVQMKTCRLMCACGGCVTSLPRGMPLPRAQVRPITLATKVLKVRYSFSTTPRRMVFISGIPEPAGDNSERLQSTVNLKKNTLKSLTFKTWLQI